MAVSAFASISLEPPLVAASIQRTSTTWPIFRGAVARFDGTLRQEVPAGDHVIALLPVAAVEFRSSTRPLVFHGSGSRQLA